MDGFLGHAALVSQRLAAALGHVLWSPGSTFSLLSLACALAIATLFLAVTRRPRPRALIRALFPRRVWAHASTRADIGWFLLNSLATGVLIGWALLSGDAIAHAVAGGAAPLLAVPGWLRGVIFTVMLFLAYDFAYWLDHWLSHRVPLLWEFHRVHHTAEVLTPFTVFRVHPVDSLVFANITAIVLGLSDGLLIRLVGAGTPHLWSGTNILLVAFLMTTLHLQHSHIGIAFRGRLGRLLLSPVHHQIHHSTRAEHFGSNLGSCLAVWDRMFGTLIVPEASMRLTFGADVAADRYAPHTMAGGLILPFLRAAQVFVPRLQTAPAILTFRQAQGEELR